MSGNMYAIHFDKKIHPIYAMCYLKSKEGQLQFSSTGTGSFVRMLTLQALYDIRIPVIPMERQMKIVERYNDLHGRLMALKQEEQDINEQLAKIMDDK